MIVINEGYNLDTLIVMYGTVAEAREVDVRGSKTRDIRDLAVELHMGEAPVITNFTARKMNLTYAKQEMLWYLRADKYDDSIEQYATMWKKLKQPGGFYYSNYGQYLFFGGESSQFMYVVETLLRDPNSRRASMVLLNREHLFSENTDLVCTYAINFHISGGALHMTVMMRSNDVIYGFTNDAFCFSCLYELMYGVLKRHLPSLQRGICTHFTNSMHVYERHFDMIERIVDDGVDAYTPVSVPELDPDEAFEVVMSNGAFVGPPGSWSYWLNEV